MARPVCAGLDEAVGFPCGEPLVPPIEVVHKKAVVLAPGSFERLDLTHERVHEEMLASGVKQLREELKEEDSEPIGYFCLSATPLIETDPLSKIAELPERVEALHD